MLTDRFIQKLKKIVGSEHVSVSRATSELYSYDASLARGRPGVAVFPGDAREVSKTVHLANETGVSYVPRGFGTNLSGGTVLPDGGLVISLARLNRILEINPESRFAVAQPGVTNLELQNALAPLNFFYAPDPASQKVATLGGNVGENSGGPRCLKYGVTTNHVLGLEVILPDGEIIRTGGATFDTPGLDLRGAMIGSEGTLGIVTELTVRILPFPQSIITMLAIYNDIGDAARSVSRIIASGLIPTTLEMMDAPIIQAVEDSYACGYPRDAAAVLIIEVEGRKQGLRNQARKIRDICMAGHCRSIREAKDNAERNRLWEGRRGAFGAVARLAPNYLVNDCSVPRNRLPRALETVARITEKYGFRHGNVFHAGDGNLHPLIFFDSRDPDQMERVKQAGWEIMEACVALGGTISGEHGIGLEKMDAMRLVFSEHDLDAQRALKRAFDSQDRLNPRKIFPEPGDGTAASREMSVDEQRLVEKIQEAVSVRQPILPVGSGTCANMGNLTGPSCIPLPVSGLDHIMDYDPDNQVVTAGAGMTLNGLQEKLKANNQWLPLRPPLHPDKHTVGGMVALDASGPERAHYGAPRDMLLGMRYIDARGRLISTGGRVVKNVTGYDMTRLMTGSLGTLGYITRATFRVSMIPEACRAVTAMGAPEICAAAAADLMTSNLIPVFVVVTVPEKDRNGWLLHAGFEGFADITRHLAETMAKRFQAAGLESIAQEAYDLYQGLAGLFQNCLDGEPYHLKADLPQEHMRTFAESLDDMIPDARLMLDWGCGRIWAGLNHLSDEHWFRLCRRARESDGHIILEKAPMAFKQRHDVFGMEQTDCRIAGNVKSTLDPAGLFAPGRLPGRV